VASAIAKTLLAPNLGGRVLVRVTDALSGEVLVDRGGATPSAPASTAKLMTAAAILAVRPASYRFQTVVRALAGSIVLIGGGDPTLTGAAGNQPVPYPGAARISDLAAQIKKSGVSVKRIVVDDSLFTGPSVLPGWAPQDAPSAYAAPITAVMADGGRALPEYSSRSGTPDLAAGRELATALGDASIPVIRGTTPAGATPVAAVESAPLSVLIEQMLHESDNVIAEVLARQVALAEKAPASFAGGAAAIRAVLARFGVQVGAGMKDGSGLAAADRVSPAALVDVLRLAADYLTPPKGVTLPTAIGTLVAALPVAGWSGTLDHRYLTGSPARFVGDVRAKTGSIDGVTTLSGYLHDSSGRLLVFSMDADRTPLGGTQAAEYALDDVVAAIAACGCR
jgi:D-alanyl-D-alanine carboxypeptidase/D-alanyl-D-alanine-endopeptidase (penicillin-binding protein 4)